MLYGDTRSVVAMCFVDFLAQTLRSPERVLLSPMGPFLSPTFVHQHKKAPWGTLLKHDLQIKILAGQGTQALRPFLVIKPPRLTILPGQGTQALRPYLSSMPLYYKTTQADLHRHRGTSGCCLCHSSWSLCLISCIFEVVELLHGFHLGCGR